MHQPTEEERLMIYTALLRQAHFYRREAEELAKGEPDLNPDQLYAASDRYSNLASKYKEPVDENDFYKEEIESEETPPEKSNSKGSSG